MRFEQKEEYAIPESCTGPSGIALNQPLNTSTSTSRKAVGITVLRVTSAHAASASRAANAVLSKTLSTFPPRPGGRRGVADRNP
ncbi:hypothetical protein [Streptomyces sp. CA-132043]|uniref:hypothetical protein n=1 Tax=Streptomyces sp. CA-132043 TaxID=3240048 RepID=UPI003D8AEB86